MSSWFITLLPASVFLSITGLTASSHVGVLRIAEAAVFGRGEVIEVVRVVGLDSALDASGGGDLQHLLNRVANQIGLAW